MLKYTWLGFYFELVHQPGLKQVNFVNQQGRNKYPHKEDLKNDSRYYWYSKVNLDSAPQAFQRSNRKHLFSGLNTDQQMTR